MSMAQIVPFIDEASRARRRILVVDDDTDLGESLVDVLDLEGCDVRMATDAQGAVTLMQRFSADVALLDIRLGRDSGVDLIPRLREVRPDLVCVMMTAHAELKTAIGAIKQGADEYLRKPLHSRELFAVLDRSFQIVRLKEEKAAAERAVSEAEERLRTIIEHAPDAITLLDPDNLRFVLVNGNAERMFGQSGADLLERGSLDFTPEYQPDGRRSAEVARQKCDAAMSGQPQEFEWLHRDLKGNLLHCEVRLSRISLDGRPFLRGSILDVSARKRMEAAACEGAERMQAIMENVADSIITTDETGIIASANLAATRIFGYERDELIGMHVRMLMPEPDRSHYDDYVRAYCETGCGRIVGLGPREVTGQRKDGAIFPLELSVSEMSAGGKRAFIGVARDIAERKRTEDRLRHAQRMEAVGRLTGGVAHDFNNLLAVIIGSAELLRDRVGPDDNQVAAVIRAAERGAELTGRLLAFSRRQPLQPKVVDLAALISRLADMLRRTLSETIDIEIAMADDLSTVEVDPGQVETALLNLAINAGPAMPDGGTLRIEAANATVDAACAEEGAKPGRYAVVSVTDTGTGMAPEVAACAFEPFFTTKETGEGSGLGLSMVYGFAEQSGGFVTIESREGEGTTVRLYLPRSGASCATEKACTEPDPPTAAGEVILVVEDDADVRALAVTLLEGLDYRVLQAVDGATALDVLRDPVPVDLMLSDMVLSGGMSGPKLAEAAKRVCAGLPVLFMAGYTGDDWALRGPSAADLEILHKPFRKHDLARAVRAALDGA